MLTKAKVIEADGEVAVVMTERKSACEGCHKNSSGEGCSICTLSGGNREFTTKALNQIGAKAGDTVEVSSKTSRVLFYSALVFLLPVVVGIIFYFVSGELTQNNIYRYISLVAGFVLCFLGVWIYSVCVGKKRCDVEIVRIIKDGDTFGDE